MGSKSKVKEEQERVRTLLSDTVTLLCKNGLSFKKNLKVQGLLGITVDDDEVFIVHVNETLGELVSASDPNQTERQSPSKTSQSGRKSPKRKRRRQSTDSNDSSQQSSYIDLDPDIEIKTEPDMVVIDEVKCEGPTRKQSCRYGDEGLNFAISSISSPNQSYTTSSNTLSHQNSAASSNPNISATQSVPSSTGPPYITGIVPNVAETSNQSSASGSFQWDSTSAQGLPGLSSWASQVTQETMSQSQQSDMSQQPGPSQTSPGGYSPGQRTGTKSKFPTDPRCNACNYYTQKKKFQEHRVQLRKQGVANKDLPVFQGQKIPSNRNCPSCLQRLDVWRIGNEKKKAEFYTKEIQESANI